MQSTLANASIAEYFTGAEIDYRLIWHLNSELCMHCGFWDKGIHSLRAAFAHENNVLAKMVHIEKNDYVLDAGCGVGGSSLYLASTIGCRVTGITITPSQVITAAAAAKRRGLSGLADFQLADFTDTQFADNTFDVVWAIESVCYATEKQDFLDEAYRILKPGGRLIVADGFATKAAYDGIEKKLMNGWLDGWHVEALAMLPAFCESAQKAGFKDVESHNFTTKIWPTAKRLYYYCQLLRVPEWMSRKVGLRQAVAKGNYDAARYQYHLLRLKLAMYGVVSAVKPG